MLLWVGPESSDQTWGSVLKRVVVLAVPFARALCCRSTLAGPLQACDGHDNVGTFQKACSRLALDGCVRRGRHTVDDVAPLPGPLRRWLVRRLIFVLVPSPSRDGTVHLPCSSRGRSPHLQRGVPASAAVPPGVSLSQLVWQDWAHVLPARRPTIFVVHTFEELPPDRLPFLKHPPPLRLMQP